MNGRTKCAIRYEARLGCDARRESTAGLTLVELAVVIAVVGILATLILPALGRARESIRKTDCLNNLRQFGIAASLYCCDSSRLPTILEWLYSMPNTPQSDISSGQLFPYLKSRAVYICPSKQAQMNAVHGDTGTLRTNHTYSMNCMMCHSHDLPACVSPARTVLFVETTNFVQALAGGLAGPISFDLFSPGFPHVQRGNFLMADGHLERLSPKEMNAAAATSEFWYPNERRDSSGNP
jgi:prepilin-type N-terminal cleavage/methylation domain-containing protein/prepilin-type processing-associated H-X9-DG protein